MMDSLTTPTRAVEAIRAAHLPHPIGPLTECFITDAVNPDAAASYCLGRCREGYTADVSQFSVEWRRLVSIFKRTPWSSPPSLFRAIHERDDGICVVTGKAGSMFTRLGAYRILPFHEPPSIEDSLVPMLHAFLTPDLASNLLKGPVPVHTNHWLLSAAAYDAFSRGLLKLEMVGDEYSVEVIATDKMHPIAAQLGHYMWSFRLKGKAEPGKTPGPDPQYIAIMSHYGGPLRWLQIHENITAASATAGTMANVSSSAGRRRPSWLLEWITTISVAVWRRAPQEIRLFAYKCLARLGQFFYSRPVELNVQPLIFGLYLKKGSAREQDAYANEFASLELVRRHTTIPVPRPIDLVTTSSSCYLVTTRIPGEKLGYHINTASDEATSVMVQDLRDFIRQLRALPRPSSPHPAIANALGQGCLDFRISMDPVGPFDHESSFNDYLSEYWPDLRHRSDHAIAFTHADLNMRNILVHRGRISGIVDWENAGWYPEYWECTKAHLSARINRRWIDMVESVFSEWKYDEELAMERRLWEVNDPWR